MRLGNKRNLHVSILFVLACCAGFFLYACGGRTGADVPTQQDPQPVVAEPSPADTSGEGSIPDLSQLNSVKAPSGILTYRAGVEFLDALPNTKVIQEDPVDVRFQPADGGGEGLAYAIYSFNLEGLAAADLWTYVEYVGAPESGSTVFLGLANQDTLAWDWHGFDGQVIRIDNPAPYRRDDGLTLVMVLVSGTQELVLRHVVFNSPSLYDEVEPNNTLNTAQPLPPVPVYAFRGSVGNAAPFFTGYDGGIIDNYLINAQDGDQLTIGVQAINQGRFYLDYQVKVYAGTDVYNITDENGSMVFIRGLEFDEDLGPHYLVINNASTDYEIYIIEGTEGIQPEAVLEAAPQAGPAPLTVALDAGASSDPNPGGQVVRYDWDFDGDGIWDLVGGTDAVVDYIYEEEGVFFPRIRVGNDLGLGCQQVRYSTSTGTCTVTVGETGYDEVEDNDYMTPGGSNLLPDIPFSGFTGNIGSYGYKIGPAYDGDHQDIFRFYAEAGRPYAFLDDNFLDGDLLNMHRNCTLGIYDLAGEYIAGASGYSKSVTFTPNETGYYYLWVGAGSSQNLIDYSLRALNNRPPMNFTVESTDAFGMAPLEVDFWVNSFDPEGTELSYIWKVDSVYYSQPEQDYASSITMTFTELGGHYIECLVTDADGLRRKAGYGAYVWSQEYDEREYNNKLNQAQVLPALPVAGFRGSLAGMNGPGLRGCGYDGGGVDLFKLPGTIDVGAALDISIAYEPVEETFNLELQDNQGNPLASQDTSAGSGNLQYTAAPADQQPYVLKLEVANPDKTHNIDYTLGIDLP